MSNYKLNPLWADITPVPQDDGPNPVAPIAYSDRFREVMDYFRAILLKDEISERALDLTKDVIAVNAANYTVWNYRRKLLFALNRDLYQELHFTKDISLNSPKNFQVWHHRREICDRLNDGTMELSYIAEALEDDAKNYHAWAYRQWVLKRFNIWGNELHYLDTLLEQDMRNNSVWNQRWYVIHHTIDALDQQIRQQEIEFAIKFILKAPNNESCWNYLRAWMDKQEYRQFLIVKQTCEAVLKSHPDCTYAANALVDVLEQDKTIESAQLARETLDKLMNEIDPIRTAYWTYRKAKIQVP